MGGRCFFGLTFLHCNAVLLESKRPVLPSGIFTGLDLTLCSWLTQRGLDVGPEDFGLWLRSGRL
jgi:hypothetical protein